MSLSETLDALDEKYYGESEDARSEVIEALTELHENTLTEGLEEFREFSGQSMERCGGVYIPYLMWTELANFIEDEDQRGNLYSLIEAFTNSDFEEPEKKKMKTLLITYFALEKAFEINKIQSLIVDKSHPDVQEFFRKVRNFVDKNKTSVDMSVEKFQMLKEYAPNFDLMRMPVTRLKEQLEGV
jgi:hypothetical protein